ncbi:MAG: DinB family protein [Cyclobacteriaceae bacterium]|nr:DinB family protein [Cyclobacteriaceae bacterium]
MNASVKSVFQELEQQREALLSLVKNIPEERYSKSILPGKWSISQVLTHILTSEKLSLGYMKKKVNAIDELRDSGVMESLRLWLLIFSQRIPLKYKAPKVVVDNTPAAMPLNQLTNEWDEIRKELATFLEGIHDKHIKRVIYKHPLTGRLDVRQTMSFFREHIIHHLPQIKRQL